MQAGTDCTGRRFRTNLPSYRTPPYSLARTRIRENLQASKFSRKARSVSFARGGERHAQTSDKARYVASQLVYVSEGEGWAWKS